ncbi:MAG: hypothetical protein H0U50_12495 [Pyrinomonadaceae bacterium]|nr:hypothetical protein [Pyrinomonadaceae bacterium]
MNSPTQTRPCRLRRRVCRTRGRFYNQTLQASGGSGTFHWMILSGNLPPGMRLDTSTGQIHGKAAVKGTWNFVIGIQDVTNMSAVASRNFTIDVKLYLGF